MRLLTYEHKKLIRAPGLRLLMGGLLVFILIFSLFGNAHIPTKEEQTTHRSEYDNNISYIIRAAERNREEYASLLSEDTYLVRYQTDVIAHYTAIKDAGIQPAPVRGWDTFFESNVHKLTALLAAILIGAAAVMAEHEYGTLMLLRLSQRGRAGIRRKPWLLLPASFAVSLSTALAALAGTALRVGLSSPFVPLCSVIRFAYCPYNISIFSYLLISLGISTLSLFVLMLFSAWMAALFRGYLPACFLSLILIVTGYGMSMLSSVSAAVYLNLYTGCTVDTLFERYRSINVFSASLPLILGLLVILIGSALCLWSVLIVSLDRGPEGLRIDRWEKALTKRGEKLLAKVQALRPRHPPRRSSIVAIEAKKSFFKSQLLLLCLVMLFVKIGYIYKTAPKEDTHERYYRRLCMEMEGELTEEKQKRILDALAESQAIMEQSESMRNAAMNGMISSEEYSVYLRSLSTAEMEHGVYQRLQLQCSRIYQARQQGHEGYIVYDTGWQKLFDAPWDIILCCLLLFFFCGNYSVDYQSGFHRIAATSKRGMGALHRAKLVLALLVSIGAYWLFTGIDLFFLMREFPLTGGTFPLISIKATSFSVSLRAYAFLLLFIKMVSAIGVGWISLLCSRFVKRTYLSLPVCLLLLVLCIPLLAA